jgi:hypothetical protein
MSPAPLKRTHINATADDRTWTPEGVGALNIGVVQCFAELIANAIDWRKFNQKELTSLKDLKTRKDLNVKRYLEQYSELLKESPAKSVICVRLEKNAVEVSDNGIGMTVPELEVALRLRGADDKTRLPLRQRKGKFGMGLKVGVLGLGWNFSIATRSFREQGEEHRIQIDARKVAARKLRLDDLVVETWPHDATGPLGKTASGTCIRVSDLHEWKVKGGELRELLGRAFSPEIEFNDIEIRITDTRDDKPMELPPCEPLLPVFIPETKIDLEAEKLAVRPDLGGGKRGPPLPIKGWLALVKVSSSGKGEWGLHTFRYGQLVEQFHHNGPSTQGLLPLEPHPNYAHLFGVVHLDMCDPNFTKVGWNTKLESWREVQAKLEPYLHKLMDASSKYRKKTGGAEAIQMIQLFKGHASSTIAKIAGSDERETLPDEKDVLVTPSVTAGNDILLRDGSHLKISFVVQPLAGLAEKAVFWRYSYRPESKELAVVVNESSPLWQMGVEAKAGDRDWISRLIANWAILDSLYFCLVYDLQYLANEAQSLRDDWLRMVYPVPKEV